MTDNQSFNEIYEKYKNLVLKTAYTYSGDYSLAADIMQETFLALYKDMQKKDYQYAEDYSSVGTWLITTARNKTLNHLKSMPGEVSIYDTDEELLRESTEDKVFGLMKEEESENLHDRIMRDLLRRKPRWHRALFLICHLGMSQIEAAEKMGMSTGAFYVMLHRIKIWIRKKYAVDYEELTKY